MFVPARLHGARVALAATLLASGATAAGAGPRRGRVVRVPRPPITVPASVRTCSLYDEAKATCDRPVEIGEVGAVIGDEGNYGLATIRAVEPQADSCGTPVIWQVELEQASGLDNPGRGILVIDVALDDRARTVTSTGAVRPGEQVLHVIDRDGDGDGDLRISQYPCDHRGALERGAQASHRCTDYWVAVGARWVRGRSDRQAACDR